MLLRFGLNRRRAIGLVQNPDDREVLAELGVKPDHIALIPGSGIDADRFRPIPEPDGPVTVAFVGRMLDDKGVRTLIAAHRMLRGSNIACALLLAGTPDPANPASIPQTEVAGWGREQGVTWLGQVADIATVWRRAHIAVLPSRREGLPKSLLEAAACGRPLIATDVPGCREIVIHEKTGLLVPVDDPQALAAAILRLVRSSQQRIRFGVAARRLVDERFSADLVGKATVALYQRLLEHLTTGPSAMGEFALPEFALIATAGLCSAAVIVLLRPLFAALRAGASECALLPYGADPAGRRRRRRSRRRVCAGRRRRHSVRGSAALAEALPLGAGVILLTIVGAVDDMFPIAAMPRLAAAGRGGHPGGDDRAGGVARRCRSCRSRSSERRRSSPGCGSSIW